MKAIVADVDRSMPRKSNDNDDNVISMASKRKGGVREAAGPGDSTYRATPEGIVHVNGEYERVLSNFDAQIVRRVTSDDGSGTQVAFDVEVRTPTGATIVTVPAADFARLRWVSDIDGAVVWPGAGVRQHLPTAIQVLSKPRSKFTFGHTGWREVDGELVFLHAGGAIGGDGLDVGVELDPALTKFVLPAAPEGQALRDVIRASLDLLDLAHEHVTVPLLGAAFRSVLGNCDFALHLSGMTGTGKSQMAALVQSFFGPEMATGVDLPASWQSTRHANQRLGFLAANTILCLDDWLPNKPGAEEDADFLFRSAGNQGGRARMGQPTYYPRGLIISTGESVMRTPSCVARLVVLEMHRDLRWDLLTEAQGRAREGVHASCMAGFISWLRPQLDDVQSWMAKRSPELRHKFHIPNLHARSPGALADLATGFFTFLTFAQDVGALSIAEQVALNDRVLDALRECGRRQLEVQLRGDPAAFFLHRLHTALASGQAHLVDLDHRGRKRRKPGRHVGWTKDGIVYLHPLAALKVARGDETPDALAVSERKIGEALYRSGHLDRTEFTGGKRRYVVRFRAGGTRRQVWAIAAGHLG